MGVATMRRLTAAIAGIAALLTVPAEALAAPPAILYAANARSATVVGQPGSYRLSLPAATAVTGFSDRPSRFAGATTLVAVARIWRASGFAADPPNAALILSRRGRFTTHVVELRSPRIAAGRVSFAVRRIPGAREAGRADRDPLAAGRYGRAELMIDDAAYPPCDLVAPFPPVFASGSSVGCLMSPGQQPLSVSPAWSLGPLQFSACIVEPAGSTSSAPLVWESNVPIPGGGYLQGNIQQETITSACPAGTAIGEADSGSYATVWYGTYYWSGYVRPSVTGPPVLITAAS